MVVVVVAVGMAFEAVTMVARWGCGVDVSFVLDMDEPRFIFLLAVPIVNVVDGAADS